MTKVWCVMEHDWEGSYLLSIWATEAAAQAEAIRLDPNAGKAFNIGVSAEEWDVQE